MGLPPPGSDDALLARPRGWPGVPGDAAEELAVVTRSGFVESRHHGHGVVVAPDGAVVAAVGTPDAVINPRSSLKPVQATACLVAGARLDGAGLAIGAGSHRGHPDHRRLVRTVLAAHDLDVDLLQTPATLPTEPWARDEVVAAGGGPASIHHNCSGKHAAMLAACVASGLDPRTYRDPDHPLQRRIRSLTADLTGTPVDHVGLDGCGAPLFTTTVAGLARMGGALGAAAAGRGGSDEVPIALAHVGRAMRAHPWAVAGIGAADTVVMQQLDGVVAKGGAEGVMLLGTADGHGVAVKVLDGADRAAVPAALGLLAATGIDTEALVGVVAARSLGHGRPVGRVHVADVVRDRAAAAAPTG